VVEVEHFGGGVEVGVVVDQGDSVFAGEDGGEQVGDADGAVPAGAGQLALDVEDPLPVAVLGGQVFIRKGENSDHHDTCGVHRP
jgi:hypothetical protein